MSVLIVLAHFPMAAAAMRSFDDEDTKIMLCISICTLTLIVFLTTAFMVIALLKFIRVFSSPAFNMNLNKLFIVVQILTISTWFFLAMAIGFIMTLNYDSIFEYTTVKALTLVELILINVNFINFMMMAHILFRSTVASQFNQKVSLR